MTERGDTEARLDALRAEYECVRDVVALSRTRMLSDRLTHTRKEAQLREAEVEEADDQADYFAERVAETAAAAWQSEADLAALEQRADAVRGEIVGVQIEEELRGFAAALRDLAPQAAVMLTRLETAAAHIQRTTALSAELPVTITIPRDAIAAATERYIALEGLLHDFIEAVRDEQRATSE